MRLEDYLPSCYIDVVVVVAVNRRDVVRFLNANARGIAELCR